jgi:hypothetical protein
LGKILKLQNKVLPLKYQKYKIIEIMRRFRITSETTIKATLFNSDGKLIAQLYDSGYTRIDQVKSALLSKCCYLPKNVSFGIHDVDNDRYWSNR